MNFHKFELNGSLINHYSEKLKKIRKELTTTWLAAKKANLSVIVVLEGLSFCGKVEVVNEIASLIDPRFFKTYLIKKPNKIEKQMCYMFRFWTKIPKKGQIVVFDGSWYYDLFFRKMKNLKLNFNSLQEKFKLIENFENMMVADGTLIVKLYFELSLKKQKFLAYRELKSKFSFYSFNVKKVKKLNFEKNFYSKVDLILNETNFSGSEWHLVSEGPDCFKKFVSLKILNDSIRKILNNSDISKKLCQQKFMKSSFKTCKPIVKSGVEFTKSKKINKAFYRFNLKKLQTRLGFFQKVLFCRKISLILVFEGTDAAGKGGAIKRIVRALDARFYRVVPICVPTKSELSRHYLWRFFKKLPAKGHFTIFDRSWYGRVLVERVNCLISKTDYEKAYGEINVFENELIDSGTILIKFWLQISKEEQLKRFEKRKKNVAKAWKLTADDWNNRKKWNDYCLAVDEMFDKTSTKKAPWHIIDSNSKKLARLQILNEIVLEINRRFNSI